MGLMAFLNLVGAAIYSARVKLIFRASIQITNGRNRFQNGGILGGMTFMAEAIKSFISW